MRTWAKWLIGGLVVVLVAVVAIPWAYINFVKEDAEPPLQLTDEPVTTTTGNGTTDGSAAPGGTSGLAGTWNVAGGSEVGYRVDEVLFGQDAAATGRTSDVTGSITLTATSVTAGEFTADLTTVTSNEDRRDGQFQGRIMNTAEFPTATFTLTEPIDFGAAPADGEKTTASATGDLTLHGVTKSVTFDVEARKTGTVIEVAGAIPVLFSDYDIPDPSRPGITVKDNGEMEFLLVFNPA